MKQSSNFKISPWTKVKVLAKSIVDIVSVKVFSSRFRERFSEHRNENTTSNPGNSQGACSVGYYSEVNKLPLKEETTKRMNTRQWTKYNEDNSKQPLISVSYGSVGYDRKVSWILQKFVPAGANGIYFAPSGTFKTFVTLDLCCSIAASVDWQDLKLSHGQVFYIAAEGDLTIARRIKAWEIRHAKSVGEKLAVVSHPIAPTNLLMKERLIEEIKSTSTRNGVKPTLVVFDTLAQCSAGLDENNSSEMGRYLAECNDISRRTGATVLNIHHTGKKGSDFRGSSSIKGNVDFMLTSEHISNKNSTRLSIVKQKEGEQNGLYMDFSLEKVSLGFDDQFGEDVTSLSVVERAFIKVEDVGSEKKTTIRDESCKTIRGFFSQEAVDKGLSKKQLSKLFRTHAKEKYQSNCPNDSALLNRLNKALDYMIDNGEIFCEEDFYFFTSPPATIVAGGEVKK